MIRNYFKIAWRSIRKNKLFSAINIIGLSVGVSCCVLIYLYVQNELSYDKFNERAGDLFRVTVQMHEPKESKFYARTSASFIPSIQNAFPEVEKATRILYTNRVLSRNENKFYDTKILYADSGFMDMFTFPVIHGNGSKALVEPYSLVLTESAAKKYFGQEEALGKFLKMSDTINLKVTAVIKDIPQNSHFRFDCVLSRSTLGDMFKSNGSKYANEDDWFFLDGYSYLLLKKNTDHKALEKKLDAHIQKEMAPEKKEYGIWMNTYLQPVTDIHLRSKNEAEIQPPTNSDITYVYIFTITAILILLIGCCNFINLSTAKSINRSKEIGLRKVIGARRSQLIFQFLSESVLLTIIGSLLSVIIVLLALPSFNEFTQKDLTLNGSSILLYLLIIVVVGLLSGLYPAMLMSSFSPIKALKGHIRHGWQDVFFRKGLVVFQFTIAIALIIGTTLILDQLSFIQNKNLGINKEQILQVELRKADMPKVQTLLKEFSRDPHVISATVNDFSFKGMPAITMLPEGAAKNELVGVNVISVDENFMRTFGLNLVAGRDFSEDYPSDVKESFVVNEAAVKFFDWGTPKQAIGKKIEWPWDKNGKVVGVVKDFNYSSLHEKISPLIIHMFPPFYKQISLRLKSDDLPQTVTAIEKTWRSVISETPFKYSFMEEDFDNLYRAEQNMKSILSEFTFLSVFIACLGLFGLAAFTIRQRFKEIGIRRVLGAGLNDIVILLSKDFLKLVIISIIIASPIAFFVMHKWLEDFAYKVSINAGVFLFAGLLAMLVAFFTVSGQAFKAALTNPVKSIRTE